MKKPMKNMILSFTLLAIAGGIQAQSSAMAMPRNDVVQNLIDVMQQCIDLNNNVRMQNPQLHLVKQASLWQEAIASIKSLRSSQKNLNRPDIAQLQQVALQENRSRELFTQLLDEYLAHFGQLYEKKAGLLSGYRTVFFISSQQAQDLPITAESYQSFVQTLQNAAGQPSWGKNVILNFASQKEDGQVVQRSLNLNQIINAVGQVSISTESNMLSTIGYGVAATAAAGAATYGAYKLHDYLTLAELEKNAGQVTTQIEQAPSWLQTRSQAIKPLEENRFIDEDYLPNYNTSDALTAGTGGLIAVGGTAAAGTAGAAALASRMRPTLEEFGALSAKPESATALGKNFKGYQAPKGESNFAELSNMSSPTRAGEGASISTLTKNESAIAQDAPIPNISDVVGSQWKKAQDFAAPQINRVKGYFNSQQPAAANAVEEVALTPNQMRLRTQYQANKANKVASDEAMANLQLNQKNLAPEIAQAQQARAQAAQSAQAAANNRNFTQMSFMDR